MSDNKKVNKLLGEVSKKYGISEGNSLKVPHKAVT